MIVGTLASPLAHGAAVTGLFVEKGASTPLTSVEVVLRSARDSSVVAHTVSGADGRFRIAGMPAARYLLRASLLGHDSFLRNDLDLTTSAADFDLGTIALAVSAIAIPGAAVSTARATAIIAPDRNIYLTKDMPMASTGNATDVLRAVPELDVDIDGRASLRGSSSVNVQINGRASPLKGDDLTTFLRQMPANRIERVEVIANPSAKFDPEGAAGILNIVLNDDLGLGLSGSFSLYAGPRYTGPGARIAWQRGPLTLFGGASGSRSNYPSESSTFRQNLLSSPPGQLRWESVSEYVSRFGMLDTSVEFALSKRSTLYSTVNASLGSSDPFTRTVYSLADSTQTETQRYARTDDGEWNNRSGSVVLGFQHVVRSGVNERQIEFRHSAGGGDSGSDGLQQTAVPASTADEASHQRSAFANRERSLQIDDTHPLGAKAKIETGYRGSLRLSSSSGSLEFVQGGVPVATPLSDVSDYEHREVFHSGYVTLGATFGKLTLQAGARAEGANTSLDVRSSGRRYDNDYRSLFPSGNAAWDFGKGRNLRLTYSKRIERPTAYYLNPDVPTLDSLNRFVGNPSLGPKYTHSYSLDVSWNGSRGSLRFSPYLRRTVDNWDLITELSPSGAATATWRNASSVRVAGVNIVTSLRQTGRFGGSMNVGVSQDHHDASNLSRAFRNDVTAWTAGGNVTFKATSRIDLQSYLRFSPARALAQGRSSAYTFLSLGSRIKLSEQAYGSLNVADPFQMTHYSSRSSDPTYTQQTNSRNAVRSVSASFTWTWGKQPEQKQRKQSTDASPADSPEPGR